MVTCYSRRRKRRKFNTRQLTAARHASRPMPAHRKSRITDAIAEVAQQCITVAEQIQEERRLLRIAAISEWCRKQAERLADDRFGTGEEPDYLADVASVAWELTALSEGKYPPSMVIRMARRQSGRSS